MKAKARLTRKKGVSSMSAVEILVNWLLLHEYTNWFSMDHCSLYLALGVNIVCKSY